MIVQLPPAATGMTQVLDALRRAFIPVVSQEESAARIILMAPGGTSWEVTVDDAGALKTRLIDGKTRPR